MIPFCGYGVHIRSARVSHKHRRMGDNYFRPATILMKSHGMKRLCAIALFMMLASNLLSQATESAKMEERAREFVRVISRPEAGEWKAFILENYTPAFREKPVKVNIQTSGAPTKSTTATESRDAMESKIAMYERLHKQFGDGEIVSLIPSDGEINLVLRNKAGVTGNFNFIFEKKKPYLIDG